MKLLGVLLLGVLGYAIYAVRNSSALHKFFGEKHWRTKQLRAMTGMERAERWAYGEHCATCNEKRLGNAIEAHKQRARDRSPMPVCRVWECACGSTWQEWDTENTAEYKERMAELDIAESEHQKPVAEVSR